MSGAVARKPVAVTREGRAHVGRRAALEMALQGVYGG